MTWLKLIQNSSWHLQNVHKINQEGEGSSRNIYKGPTGKAKEGKDGGWEVGLGGVGESGGGKMETTVFEQQ